MPSYSFDILSPLDFEALCHDLFEAHLKVPLQAFTAGPDGGIDLRHAFTSGVDIVIQCKRFKDSTCKQLLTHMRSVELPKVQDLSPSRYILATSCGLTPDNVNDLFALLQPYVITRHDIVGATDLLHLLGQHPTIERTHYKLWIASAAVLDRLLHSDIYNNTEATKAGIRRRLSLFVPSTTMNRVRAALEKDRVCILAGAPGVGKTTAAQMLLAEYLASGWEVISLTSDVREGGGVFSQNPDDKQIFYYDDFLGHFHSAEMLNKNEDARLLSLIDLVTYTPNRRLLLTTRDYILERANQSYPRLAEAEIGIFKLVVKAEDLTRVEKARILANHLYFFDVPYGHIEFLVMGKEYLKIVDHKRYNPRVIEWMTKRRNSVDGTPQQYLDKFIRTLDSPIDMWRDAVSSELSVQARALLFAIVTCGSEISLVDAKHAWHGFLKVGWLDPGSLGPLPRFNASLRELEGSFVQVDRRGTRDVVRVTSPSISDVIRDFFVEGDEFVLSALDNMVFWEQLVRLVFLFGAELDWSSGEPVVHLEKAVRGLGSNVLNSALDVDGMLSKERRKWEIVRGAVRIADILAKAERLPEELPLAILSEFREVDCRSEDAPKMSACVRAMLGSPWIEKEVQEWLKRRVLEWIMSIDEVGVYDDGLWAAAELVESVRNVATTEEDAIVVTRITEALRDEVDNVTDQESIRQLERLVDDIGRTVGVNVDRYLEALDIKLGEAQERETVDQGIGSAVRNEAIRGPDDISGILEALLD